MLCSTPDRGRARRMQLTLHARRVDGRPIARLTMVKRPLALSLRDSAFNAKYTLTASSDSGKLDKHIKALRWKDRERERVRKGDCVFYPLLEYSSQPASRFMHLRCVSRSKWAPSPLFSCHIGSMGAFVFTFLVCSMLVSECI